jgi:phage terminase large subunit
MRTGLAPLLRTAEQVIRHAKQRQFAPHVVWAPLDSSQEQVAKSLRALRKQSSGRILAAVPYGYAVPDGIEAVPFAPKMFRLLHPSRGARYRVGSGGRGSGKSHAVATALMLRMLSGEIRILCAREIQRSLRESVHHLLVGKIDEFALNEFFDVNEREIRCVITQAEVIFAGLMSNVQQLKSLEGVGLCWVEESESVSHRSIEVLTPTIRAPGSEIWFTLNPTDPDAPVMEFTTGQRPNTLHEHIIFSDNPWFPESLEGERAYLQTADDDTYRHVWLGECRLHSDAQVFKGKYSVEEFEATPNFWNGPYFGADFGFIDPTTMVRAWVFNEMLFIDYEAYATHCDIDRMVTLFDEVPGSRNHVVRADCARPELIHMLKYSYGFPKMIACEKWKGDFIEDGISHIRGYRQIVIHPRCEHTIREFRLYSRKVDKLSGDVLPDLVDANNHAIDALRYALEPLIRKRGEWGWTSIPKGGL